MERKPIIAAVVSACLTTMLGSTLQRLSLNDMIHKSTIIVRATVLRGNSATLRGPLIYTHYQLSVTQELKGSPGPSIDVAVPGGMLNGIQQPVAGAPALSAGQEYVFFLWTSSSGLTQVIGLSQGLFKVTKNAHGQEMVSRGAANSPMVDTSGQPVTDTNFEMPLLQLISKIQGVLAGGSGQ